MKRQEITAEDLEIIVIIKEIRRLAAKRREAKQALADAMAATESARKQMDAVQSEIDRARERLLMREVVF